MGRITVVGKRNGAPWAYLGYSDRKTGGEFLILCPSLGINMQSKGRKSSMDWFKSITNCRIFNKGGAEKQIKKDRMAAMPQATFGEALKSAFGDATQFENLPEF